MITRIEIDGFKTFKDFTLDLAPFQVIIGANGSGKSNLFDAIRLLSRLADYDLDAAFQNLRGESHELFTVLPNNQTTDRIHLGVELLIETTVEDDWGDKVELNHPRLRYDLTIGRRKNEAGFEQLSVLGESLRAIPKNSDPWGQRYLTATSSRWGNASDSTAPSYINTAEDKQSKNTTVYLIPERLEAKGRGRNVGFTSGKIERTLLSRVDTAEHAHALAVRQEMRHWRFLHLDPERLRKPSFLLDNIPNAITGNFVPLALAHLKSIDPALLRDISFDLSCLIPDIQAVEVEYDEARKQYYAYVTTRDKRRFFLPGLSDGTLRILALIILGNDPEYYNVFGFEEPENSVHPAQLKRLVRLMREMTTDLSDPEQAAKPLKQLLVTTHSPELVSELEMEKGELVFAELVTRIEPGQLPMLVTRMTPVCTEMEGNKAAASYTRLQVLKFLNSDDLENARKQLRKASA